MAWEWVAPVSSASGAVIVGGIGIYSTLKLARLNATHTDKVARENRVQQRLADAYVKVLSLAEQEGQWIAATTYNCSRDKGDLWESQEFREAPKPAITDRSSAAALLAAFGSAAVLAQHSAWRAAADAAGEWIQGIDIGMHLNGAVPDENVPPEQLKRLVYELQPKEAAARQALAEAVADELGHRRAETAGS